MVLRIGICLIAFLLASIQGCSSHSSFANASTAQFGDWSPVGSRQITRQKQLALASHYRLYVTSLKTNPGSEEQGKLDAQFAQQLARQLRRYYLQVDESPFVDSLQAALIAANNNGADILMLPQVQSWPDIDPIRVQQCETDSGEKELSLEPCQSVDKQSEGEMALSIALYDVRAGVAIDSISVHSQRGMGAFVYDNSVAELEELCKMIAGQLSPQAHPL